MRESVAEHAPDSLSILEPEFISDMFLPVPNEDLHLVHQAHTPNFLLIVGDRAEEGVAATSLTARIVHRQK
jgi:hypothetical protein